MSLKLERTKSNRMKFRMFLINHWNVNDVPGAEIAIIFYPERKHWPLACLGFLDENGLFTLKCLNTFNMSTRDFLKKEHKFKRWERNGPYKEEISGSFKVSPEVQQYLAEFSRNSFAPENRFKPQINPLHPMLLIEYLKKNAKFYGKKERIFQDGGTQSSQD